MPTRSGIDRFHNEAREAHYRMEIQGDSLRVRCVWPIDLQSEEWFHFSLVIPRSVWEAALETLRDRGEAEFADQADNRIHITSNNGDTASIDMIKGK